jgi:tetratricopeptide (TPR) repeat protein
MPQAKAAAATALQIDPSLAEAHAAMGSVLMFYDFNWIGAEQELHRATQLSPSLAGAHDLYGQLLATLGRADRAREEMTLAQQLDPLSLLIINDSGWVAYLARDYPYMLDLNRKALDIDPRYWPAMRDIGVAYEKLGRYNEAIAMLEKARTIDTNPSILEMLGGAYAAAGQHSKAAAVVDELTRVAATHYVCPYEIATVFAGLDDPAKTLDWLEKGFRDRADCMPWTRFDPKLDSLRTNAKFQDLLTRMGLPK